MENQNGTESTGIEVKPPARDYEVTITVMLPGYAKPTTCRVTTKAYGNVEAVANAQLTWAKAVEPRDVHVKELPRSE